MATPLNSLKNNPSPRWRNIGAFLLLAVVLVLVNVVASGFIYRLDVTSDKRYTIMPATRQLLTNLTDDVYIEVYLEGDFPAGFERLQRSIRETLDQFRVYAGDRIQYSFIDPSASSDPKTRSQTYEALVKRGLTPTNLFDNAGGQRTEKIIFPGAIIQARGKEVPAMLLKGNQSAGAQQRLNQSVENVEYELATAIRQATQQKRKRIAIIRGHGEHTGLEFNDLAASLKGLYDLEPVDLPKRKSLSGYDAAIVAKPDSAFSEPDKFKLDQLLVNGGKLLFFIDMFDFALDSIKPDGSIHVPLELNLDDQLFHYGVRANADLVMDINSAYIPLVVGMVGNQPQTQAVPWRYYPRVNTYAEHPIVRNLDAMLLKFAGTLDTVKAVGIRKTILASTGQYSRIIPSPVRMSFNDARLQPAPELYGKAHLPVAVLLEGKFTSLYTNRLAPTTEQKFEFKSENLPGALLVVSDGDLPLNEISRQRQSIYPLGYDRVSGVTHGQKDFILNTLSYMLGEDNLILARNREIILRPLDKIRVERERSRWQTINLVVPLVLTALFGLVRAWVRRRKYGKR